MIDLFMAEDIWLLSIRLFALMLNYTFTIEDKTLIMQGHLYIGIRHVWGICMHIGRGGICLHRA